ncbi:AraC family transcriptional regulator [Trinickia sp. YCB016]
MRDTKCPRYDLSWNSNLICLAMLKNLTASIERFCGDVEGVCGTPIPELRLFRATTPDAPFERSTPKMLEPALCVVVQGSKQATLGVMPFLYEAGQYSIVSVDLPATNVLVHATAKRPFLGLMLKFEMSILSDMLLAVPVDGKRQLPNLGMMTSPLTTELTDCLTRLVGALANPQDAAILAPLIEREVVYRLLCGPQGALIRQIAQADSRLSQIRKAIEWIRVHYASAIKIDEIAEVANMSLSTFHEHFKAVTSMTPLQYQKHLRLHSARRLIITRQLDAGAAAFAVGYDSPSQFNREYKRLFGEPPLRDAMRLRDLITAEA